MADPPEPARASRGRWWRIPVGTLLLVLLVPYCCSRLASPWTAVRLRYVEASPELVPPSPLRIGIYNIAHGRGPVASNLDGGDAATREARLRDIAALLAAERLDLVVLNEVDFRSAWSGHVDQAEAIAELAGFTYRAEQRNIDVAIGWWSWRFGNVVLSKHPIESAEIVPLPARSRWESALAGRKQALACVVRIDGRRVRLLAVHLEHRDEETRIAAAERIEALRAASSEPLVCAGDFNSAPLGWPGAEPAADGRTALSVLLAGGGFATLPTAPPGMDGLTFSATQPDRLIDWVLVPAGWRTVERRVIPSVLSDHRPVVLVVEPPPTP